MKYNIEELKDAVKRSLSIAGVCRILNIRPIGGNYRTLKKLFKDYYNDITKIDTIQICEVDIPACNYDKDSKNEAKLRIKLQSLVQDATQYSGELWLDCIILEPVIE